jgi:tetratricopeptide (TPR) repeat protein
MRDIATFAIALALVASPAAAQTGATGELGTIQFPTSATGAAQAAFVTGIKALHNFEFDTAGDAFRAAQKADPGFALAYWGEAMSFNHPLWAQQDLPAARRVLERLAPTAAGRAAKAPAGKERGLIESLEVLYGAGDKYARDVAYCTFMKGLYGQYRGDDEIAILYALSLLGRARPGESNLRNAMQAAAIAEDIFRRNPQHPGAAHFIIHAFDDPDHAILALPAARAYAKIAPAAAHALHMPSHIFVQLGLWDDVVNSNIVAYKAAVALAEQKKLPRGREDFHALSWLQYGYLQQGRLADAEQAIATAKAVADKDRNPAVAAGYAGMKARQVVESGNWEKLPLAASTAVGGAAGSDSNAAYLFAAGYSGAKIGDIETANAALTRLRALRTEAETSGNAYRAKPLAIMEKEIMAVLAAAKNDVTGAEQLLKEATAIELTLDAPSGPPEPLKPSFEVYGEFLLAQGRRQEAAAQFEQSLLRMPNRRLAVQALQQAKPQRSTGAGQP